MSDPRDHTRGRGKIPFNRTTLRLREIERIIGYRHAIVPHTDDDELYLVPIAQLLRRNLSDRIGMPTSHEVLDRLKVWADRWAPTTSDERLAEIVSMAMRVVKMETADQMAMRLRLSDKERSLLGITTIGAYDVNKAARKRRRKHRKRERDRINAAKKRVEQGIQPRSDYLARSLSRNTPWIADGISRRTWERRRNREKES